jgi:hypothetical protein
VVRGYAQSSQRRLDGGAPNYVSAWLGSVAIPHITALYEMGAEPEPPLNHVGTRLMVIALAALVLSIAVELPFALLAMRRSARSFVAKSSSNAAVQILTWSALALLYASVSQTSLLTRWERVRDASALSPPKGFTVYYVGADGASLWSVRPGVGTPMKLDTGARFSVALAKRFRLVALPGHDGLTLLLLDGEQSITLLNGLAGTIGEPPFDTTSWGDSLNTRVFDPQPGVQPLDWIGAPMFWSGVAALDPLTRAESVSLTFEVPTERWVGQFITVLPDGSAVFAFGPQICLATTDRRISALATGSRPVVIKDP